MKTVFPLFSEAHYLFLGEIFLYCLSELWGKPDPIADDENQIEGEGIGNCQVDGDENAENNC